MKLSQNEYTKLEEEFVVLVFQLFPERLPIDEDTAQEIAKTMLTRAINRSKEQGTYYLPPNFGDIILGDADTTDPSALERAAAIRERMPLKRKEGVRDEDIRWWWNKDDIERQMALVGVELHQMISALEAVQIQGLSYKLAKQKARKYHVFYGNPSDTSEVSGNDRALPPELKNRIDTYIEMRGTIDFENFRQDIKQSSTLNAFLRKEIKRGRI